MAHPDWGKDFSRFDAFDIHRTTYKTVSDHEIFTHVLIPKNLTSPSSNPSRPSPLVLRFHGGGFVTASSLFPDWFAPWTLALAARHSAVIVSPDYRLLPEASMDDVLADMDDFWAWVHAELPAFVREKTRIEVDTQRILTAGDSAGGYLSLQLGLDHTDQIRAVTAAYPMVACDSPDFTQPREKSPFGVPHVPIAQVDALLEQIRKGEVPGIISADAMVQRLPIMFSLVQNGKYGDYLPLENRRLHMLGRLDDGDRFPRGGVFVLHGDEDTVVPVGGSVALQDKIREVDPELKFSLAIRPGEHGFDATTKLDEEWMATGLKHLVDAWLA